MRDVHPLSSVEVLVLEIDHVLTDGRTWLDQTGAWRRSLSVRDRMGMRRLQKAGYRIAVISSLQDLQLETDLAQYGFDYFQMNCFDRSTAFARLLKAEGIEDPSRVACVGLQARDFFPGSIAIAVSQANQETKSLAHLVTKAAGGDCAVMEICGLLLREGALSGGSQHLLNNKRVSHL